MDNNEREEINVAEEYALFGHPDTTMRDCDFIEDIIKIRDCPSPDILDIACGTGRHALEIARRGYSVTGVDISKEMITAARKLNTIEGLNVRFDQCDMLEMSFNKEYDIAYIFFNTMGLLTCNEDILIFLNRVRDALRPNGLFAFQVGNLWSYIAEGNFTNSVYENEQEKLDVRRKMVMHMVIGPYNNIYRMHYDKRYWREGKELQPKSESIDLRIFSLNELDILLELGGFQLLKVFGDTDFGAVIDNPAKVRVEEKPYHSYVVLAMRIRDEVEEDDGKFDYRTEQWCTRRKWLNKSYNRNKSRRSISLGNSKRCDTVGS